MRKGLFKLRLRFEDEKIIDCKSNSFDELEDSFDQVRRKFKGGRE